MKIAIVSDTHGNVKNFKKAIDWIKSQNINTILHCGDIGSLESLRESLVNFNGKLFGVLGNMDKDFRVLVDEYNKITGVKIGLDILEIELDTKKIAITHLPDTAKELAESGKFQMVFYGHTHKPWEERVENCRMLNPGELAGQLYKPTFAIYDTETDSAELKVLERL